MKNWFNKTVEETITELNVNIENGLDENEAKKRQEEYGLNKLKEAQKDGIIKKFFKSLMDPMIMQY